MLFRLLFVAYAEDKGLLPYRSNGRYQRHALKTLARDLAAARAGGRISFDARSTDLWRDLQTLWTTVDEGNEDWGVPAYNGGLFSSKPEVNPAGAAIAELVLSNADVGPALDALLVDTGPDGLVGPVDFRSLSVREFGTIYEGLLESSLSVAPTDLALDRDGTYVPARGSATVAVQAGEVYFHNNSGVRKATGSYFTKPFAVEHLLDSALEPALDDHVTRLERLVESGDEPAAAEAFFDFRCVDLAMGSAHFLVAAVDRIEARLSAFLALHPIAPVLAELETLRSAALRRLGDLAEGLEIEQATLLRRQIARRCIYGLDRNRIAVELARLAVWIHTFVPGLPLSFLDHGLVWGDSLTGIGTVAEALGELEPGARDGQPSMFREQVEGFLGRAGEALRRLALATDTTLGEVHATRDAHREALAAVEPARRLFDLLVAARLGEASRPVEVSPRALVAHPDLRRAERLADELHAVHFPIAFPEVFLRDNAGFDCILGNPPWEKVKVEEHAFWGLRFPGHRSLSSAEQERRVARYRRERPDLVEELEAEVEQKRRLRQILAAGPHPLGSGDPDLYKAFCWRFWQLLRIDGAMGVVLPRSALSGSGTSQWRQTILDGGSFDDVTTLKNKGGWVFDEVTPQYTVGLVMTRKGAHRAGTVRMRGPFASRARYEAARATKPVEFPVEDFRAWTSGASFPLLPTAEAAEVFAKLRAHPRFDAPDHGWAFRPVREVDATNDKDHMILDSRGRMDLWPVYKGASFDLWSPDTGKHYASVEPDHITRVLQDKRRRQQRHAKSAFSAFPLEWVRDLATLPCLQPRIAFRDVARATDSRTVIAALVPPRMIPNHTAPYLLRIRGDERDEAFLLGVLGSIPLDWYARRVVETHVTFDVLGSFPIPRVDADHPLRRRLVEIYGRLAAVDGRYGDWAQAVGVPVASVPDQEKPELLAELDAAVALLYGLDEGDVRLIFETFHDTWDPRERLEHVLQHHRRLRASTR